METDMLSETLLSAIETVVAAAYECNAIDYKIARKTGLPANQVATILQYIIVEQSSRLMEVVGPDYVDQVVDLASLQQCIGRLKQARADVEIEAAERMKFAKMLASELDADTDKRMQILDQLREDKQKTLERLRDDKKRLYEEAYTPTSKKNQEIRQAMTPTTPYKTIALTPATVYQTPRAKKAAVEPSTNVAASSMDQPAAKSLKKAAKPKPNLRR